MFNDDYDFILDDFLSAHEGTSCDSCYVLRKMLSRGASEAHYRYRINEDDKAHKYQKLSNEIEDVLDDLERMLDERGRIHLKYRVMMMRAIKTCQCLLAIAQAETNADYNNLETYLTDGLCLCRQEELKAA
ncbi:hypothetical protein [Bradyrhizobium sp. P5_C11_2]